MKATMNALAELYAAALRTYLDHESPEGMESAREMGRQSLAQGLETLEVAKMHEAAFKALVKPDCLPARLDDMTRQAEAFFTEAITPIEKTHSAALETDQQLHDVTESLDQRTKDLADSNEELHHQITERLMVEATFKIREAASGQLLKDSRLLEAQLQGMVRQILSANEEERRKMSLHLHDGIAQTLLGIHVRLLALKKEAADNNASLNAEIAATQKLVEKSARIIASLTKEFDSSHDRKAH